MKKSQLKKLIKKTIKEAQLGSFQNRDTPHYLDPQDLEYYLDQIQGMSTDEAIFHLGKLGLTSGQSKKVISQLDTEISDMFRGHSDYEDPFPSTKKGIGDLGKSDLYEEQITKLYQQGTQQELRMVIRKILKENLQEWEGMIETELNETLQDEIEGLRSQGMSDDDIWHELDARGVNPQQIDSILNPDPTPWFKRDIPYRQK